MMAPKIAAFFVLACTTCPAIAQNVTETLINPYLYCVGRATGRQPDRFRDPDSAIERAFLACQTEELAIRSYGEMNNLSLAETNAIMALHRRGVKKELIEKLSKGPPPPITAAPKKRTQ